MRSHLYKIYQQAAFIQVQRFIFVRLLAEYAKRLKEAGDTFQASCPISVPLGQLNGIKVLDDVCEV